MRPGRGSDAPFSARCLSLKRNYALYATWLVPAARGQGNALVLITHESAVAAVAQRTISLKDGRILTDTQT